MKKTYIQPRIRVKVLTTESLLLGASNEVTRTTGNSDIIYGGGDNRPVRAGEKSIWDDKDDSSDWVQ